MPGIPSEIGGEPTRDEAVYLALRAALGTLAGPIDGLEDAWRRLKAKALVDAAVSVELACMQALPAYATVHIPVYEKLLKISISSEDTEEDRRQRITEVWTAKSEVDFENLNKSLMAISTKLFASAMEDKNVTSTRFGRYYSLLSQPTINNSKYPNFSTSFIVFVQYTLGLGEIIIPDQIAKEVAELLNTSLPSWVDYVLHTGMGFFCNGVDNSYLNYKTLGN